MVYRGRFAPTPSGPLHFGSLVAALASYLDARAAGGEWLVRMEDVDPPRVAVGAARRILDSLAAHGLVWDGAVLEQSRRGEAYAEAIRQLQRSGLIYGCDCSRKRIAQAAVLGVDGPVYPGFCRGRPPAPGLAWRFLVPDRRVAFRDRLLGWVACDLARECGDFPLRRADGVYTYQIAVVVDDAAQGVSHVVRGADLLASTPRQIALQQALGLPTPEYLHVPVVLDGAGCKLSKQTLAAPLSDDDPLPALRLAGRFLGLPDHVAPLAAWLKWATERWPARLTPPCRGRKPPGEPHNPAHPVASHRPCS